ncbi:hypothetical protein ACLOJK_018214 [Asimina triloba]
MPQSRAVATQLPKELEEEDFCSGFLLSDVKISKAMTSFCGPLRNAWARATEGCFQRFPCLADPAERSSLGLKVAMVAIHLIIVSALFAFDSALFQYVLDAMRVGTETHASYSKILSSK